jgi:hypothetical protein
VICFRRSPYDAFQAGSGRRPPHQGVAAREWLAALEAELLPVPYFHQVFTLPAQIADIAYQNKVGDLRSFVQGLR